MAEEQVPSPEGQEYMTGDTAAAHAKARSLPGIVHSLRSYLISMSNAAFLLKTIDLKDAHPFAGDAIDIIDRNIKKTTVFLEEALNNDPLPEVQVADVHSMIAQEVRRMCMSDDCLAGKCILLTDEDVQAVTDGEPQPEEGCEGAQLHVTLSAVPEDLKKYTTRFSPASAAVIFEVHIKNSLRKGATEMRVTFERTEHKEMAMIISDNGPGMELWRLRDLRIGKGSTDKTVGDGLAPGETLLKHGQGIAEEVMKIIRGKCKGHTDIYSLKKPGTVKDPEGDVQDAESLEEHRFFPHGVTFRHRLPLEHIIINGEYPKKVPAAQPLATEDVQQHTRRNFGLALTGGVAAAAMVTTGLYVLNRPSAKARSMPVMTGVELGPNGNIISVHFKLYGKQLRYERGQGVPAGWKTNHLMLDKSSLLIVEPGVVDGQLIQKMFLCSTPEGTLGFVPAVNGGYQEMMYLLAPPSSAGAVEFTRESEFPLRDTVFGNMHQHMNAEVARAMALKAKRSVSPASLELLRHPQLAAMESLLRKAARTLTKQSQHTGGASADFAGTHLLKLLVMRDVCMSKGVPAQTTAELERYLSERDHFIIAAHELGESLLHDPAFPAQAESVHKNGNSICLTGIPFGTARKIIPA